MTNDDLIAQASVILFEEAGSICKCSDGKWWNYEYDAPTFDTAVEAYEDLVKRRACIESGCERKRTGEKYCESHSPYQSKTLNPSKPKKVGGLNI